MADTRNIFAPARDCFIDRLECLVNFAVSRYVVQGVAILIFVGSTDLKVALPVI